MALFYKNDLISKARSKLGMLYEAPQTIEKKASETLLNESKKFSKEQIYDIFLSHSYSDKTAILGLKFTLEEKGFSVYVDWIVDRQLVRENVTKENANVLRSRMANCKSLLYATSENATKSKWMPWELGYFDGLKKGKVAIVPISDSSNKPDFKGQEYLGLYPYVEIDIIDNIKVIYSNLDKRNLKYWI